MWRVTERKRLRHSGFVIGDKSFKPDDVIANYVPYIVDEYKYPLTDYDRLRLTVYDTEAEAQEAVEKLKAIKKAKYTVLRYEPKNYGSSIDLARIDNEPDDLAMVSIMFLIVNGLEKLSYEDRSDIMQRLNSIRQNLTRSDG